MGQRHCRAAFVLTLVVSAGLLAVPEARAQEETPENKADAELPAGRFGIKAGVRGGGGIYDFGLGATTAIVAGYHPVRMDQRVSFGGEWSVGWSFFEFNDTASITGSVRLLEFEFGARMRIRPNLRVNHFLVLGTGVLLLRSNVPLPPSDQRAFIGPYISLGYEPKIGKTSLGVEVRSGLLAFGPRTITLSVTFTVGK